jgi:hypothetical protein
MAAECRRLAAAANKGAVREQLLDVAEQFERLAQDRQLAPLRRAVQTGKATLGAVAAFLIPPGSG